MDAADHAPTLADFVAAWDLFRDPVFAAVLAGFALGYLGVYIVLRRLVFVSAALSQTAGLGVAFAFYLQIAFGATGALGEPLVWATVATFSAIYALSRQRDDGRLSRESFLGWAYLVGGAGALILGTKIQQEAHDIAEILFGTAVLVRPEDLRVLSLVVGAVMVVQLACGRGFRFVSFDPDGARVRRLPVRLLDALLFGGIALVVSFGTRVLGALPIFAFSVLPAMAAILVAPSVRSAMWLAALLGAIAGGAGYVIAFVLSWPVGASQAAVAAALVVLFGAARWLGETSRSLRQAAA